MRRIPTTIFSGFLGSGKTTIIAHLIDKLQSSGTQVVYLKNEIGETDLDAKILQTKNIKAKELLNGCICCTLVGGFSTAITDIVEQFHPDKIIVEASGAADPSALALAVTAHPLLLRDGVIGIIDVVNFKGFEELTITTKEQTKFIDIILFNKVELASDDDKRRIVGYVRELNEHSPIFETIEGRIDPKLVLGSSSQELEQLLKQKEKHHEHIEHDEISAVTVELPKKVSQEKIEEFIHSLPKQVFRTKGIFTNDQGEKIHFNSVAKRVTFEKVEGELEIEKNFWICIGYRLETIKDELTKEVSSLSADRQA